jgi:hypothetical protein
MKQQSNGNLLIVVISTNSHTVNASTLFFNSRRILQENSMQVDSATIQTCEGDKIKCSQQFSVEENSTTSSFAPQGSTSEPISGSSDIKSFPILLTAILGGLGGILLVLIIASVVVIVMRRRKREYQESSPDLSFNLVELKGSYSVHSSLRNSIQQQFVSLGNLPQVPQINIQRKMELEDEDFFYEGTAYGGTLAIVATLKSKEEDHTVLSFLQEISSLMKIRHPNCIQFLGLHVLEKGRNIFCQF